VVEPTAIVETRITPPMKIEAKGTEGGHLIRGHLEVFSREAGTHPDARDILVFADQQPCPILGRKSTSCQAVAVVITIANVVIADGIKQTFRLSAVCRLLVLCPGPCWSAILREMARGIGRLMAMAGGQETIAAAATCKNGSKTSNNEEMECSSDELAAFEMVVVRSQAVPAWWASFVGGPQTGGRGGPRQ